MDLYIDYIFNKSVEKQYNAFHKGFKIVCGGPVLNMFQAHELRDVLIGNENYDWDAFENNAIYKEGYKSSDPTVGIVQPSFQISGIDSIILHKFIHFSDPAILGSFP